MCLLLGVFWAAGAAAVGGSADDGATCRSQRAVNRAAAQLRQLGLSAVCLVSRGQGHRHTGASQPARTASCRTVGYEQNTQPPVRCCSFVKAQNGGAPYFPPPRLTGIPDHPQLTGDRSDSTSADICFNRIRRRGRPMICCLCGRRRPPPDPRIMAISGL